MTPAERADKARSAIGGTKSWRKAMQDEVLPPGSVILTAEERTDLRAYLPPLAPAYLYDLLAEAVEKRREEAE